MGCNLGLPLPLPRGHCDNNMALQCGLTYATQHALYMVLLCVHAIVFNKIFTENILRTT